MSLSGRLEDLKDIKARLTPHLKGMIEMIDDLEEIYHKKCKEMPHQSFEYRVWALRELEKRV